jgi:hypothetical protein
VDCGLLDGDWSYFGVDSGYFDSDPWNPPCNYDVRRSLRKGSLVSPVVSLPTCVSTVGIEFDSFRHVESYDGAYDQTWVDVSFDGGATWQPVWYKDSRDESPECEHVRVCCAVPETRDQVQVRFSFDTVDPWFNRYPGWAVDNVVVVNADVAPGFPPCGTVTVSSAVPSRDTAHEVSVMNIPNPIRDVDTTTFVVRGLGVTAIRVRVFSLDGVLVYEQEASGNEIVWHTDSLTGEYVANGVYIYLAWVQVDEVWVPTEFQKLVVLR